jgi:neopullulanase
MVDTPDWVKHAVFYQIFPDRFAKSGKVTVTDGLNMKPWGAPPEEQGFQGGDLYGVVERLDYLDDLGVTALYLNPIFASAANHRYHTYDYYEVDPLLGGNDALDALLDAAHDRGMKVVLDGVFNHASRGFWPFHHVLENGGNSPYVDWFRIRGWPLRPYSPDPEVDHNYDAWAGIPALPEFNTDCDEVRDFLLGVAEHWMEVGIDGWRLDVPNEIDDDAFWRDFRDTVKGVDPEAYIVGEIWHEAQRWLQGDQFDAVMNYPFLSPTISFFGADTLRDYDKLHLTFEPINADAFADEVESVFSMYDWEVVLAQLNLLGSHDMARPLWIVGDDRRALKLSVLFQMTSPGAPCIYYGDEVGLSAGDDPHCREAFPWEDREAWDDDLLAHYRSATALRHEHEVLRTGRFDVAQAVGRTVTFRRTFEGERSDTALCIFNAGSETAEVDLTPADAGHPHAVLPPAWPTGGTSLDLVSGPATVSVPARSARIWIME